MMQNVNGWLMALSFVLGLVLTLALLIRRVKREVPEYATLAAGAGAGAAGGAGVAGAAKLKGGGLAGGGVDADEDATVKVPKLDADGDATVKAPKIEADDDATVKAPKIDVDADASTAKPGAVAAGAAAAGAATGGAAAKFADTSGDETAKIAAVTEEPFGPGSARVAAGAGAPPGWTVKGNEDSMLYHTPESPSYKRTIAEVWFRDVPTAEAAGFHRWDSGKSQRGEE